MARNYFVGFAQPSLQNPESRQDQFTAENTMTIRTAGQNGTLGLRGGEKDVPSSSHESGASLHGTQNGLPVLNGAKGDATSPYDNPRLTLVDRFIDEPRSLRVAVIGGGLSGILAGVLLPKKVPGIKLTIYEKNADLVRGNRNLVWPYLADDRIGWHMVRKCLSRSTLRYPLACVPEYI